MAAAPSPAPRYEMKVTELRTFYADERDDFWTFVSSLSDEDLAHPSLCAGWSINDVVAHVGAWDRLLGFDSPLQLPVRAASLTWLYVRGRGATYRVNEILKSPSSTTAPPPFRRHLFDRIAPGSQLAELVIHHQDIRRPLARPRLIPSPRLRAALDGLARLAGVDLRSRTADRRWEATDLDWSTGRAALTVRGRGEAVLLALAGRPIADDELVADQEATST